KRTSTRALLFLPRLQRRLRRRQAGDRHAERRATHVIQPNLVTELHAVRLAAVLAADADLQVAAAAAPLLDADPHQPADAVEVDHLERVLPQDLRRRVLFSALVLDLRRLHVTLHSTSALRAVTPQ